MFSPIPPARTLTAHVASQIEKMIRGGSLSPGERLPPEHELISTLSVSRTVLREAVSALRAQGLLTSRRGAGVFVANLPPQPPFRIRQADVSVLSAALALLEFRAGVEIECAGLAAARRTEVQMKALTQARIDMITAMKAGQSGVEADMRFHMCIAEAANNPYFPDFLTYLGQVTTLPRNQLYLHESQDQSKTAYISFLEQTHLAIEEAIISGDAIAAREAMRMHFLAAAERYGNAMGNAPDVVSAH